MSSDEEDEERVQLYSALKRNQKRQIYGTWKRQLMCTRRYGCGSLIRSGARSVCV